jgi:hypothetical protein
VECTQATPLVLCNDIVFLEFQILVLANDEQEHVVKLSDDCMMSQCVS